MSLKLILKCLLGVAVIYLVANSSLKASAPQTEAKESPVTEPGPKSNPARSCSALLELAKRIQSIREKDVRSFTASEWSQMEKSVREALNFHPDLLEIEAGLANGTLTIGPNLELKSGKLITNELTSERETLFSLFVESGYATKHWRPLVLRLIHEEVQKRTQNIHLSPSDKQLLRQSRSIIANHWRVLPAQEQTSNMFPPEVHELEHLLTRIANSDDLTADLHLLEEASRNPLGFARWLNRLDPFELPFIKDATEKDQELKKLVDSIQSKKLPLYKLSPEELGPPAEIYGRIRLIFNHFIRYAIANHHFGSLRVIIPRKKQNGDTIYIFKNFQISFSRVGDEEKIRIRWYSEMELEHLGTRAKLEESQPRPKIKTYEMLRSSPSTTGHAPVPKVRLTEDEIRWRELLRPFDVDLRQRLSPLRELMSTDSDFLQYYVFPLFTQHKALLQQEGGPRLIAKALAIIQNRDRVSESERMDRLRSLFEAKLRLVSDSESQAQSRSSSDQNASLDDELPEEFKVARHQIPWTNVLEAFARHGWRVSRWNDPHLVLEYKDSGHTIALKWYGPEYPTAFARTDFRRGLRLIKGITQ